MFKFLSQSSTYMWFTKKIDVITKGKMFLPWSILMPVPLFFFGHVNAACGIFIPQPGIKPMPLLQ